MASGNVSSERKIVIIAGPNGAGKTTFAREFLPNEAGCPMFVNVDLIAMGLSPFRPEAVAIRAGRIMLEQIHAHVKKRESFAFETTLSGLGYARMIPKWRAKGYRVKLIFLRLPTAKMAISRVRLRVREGGHSVAESVVRRRFKAGLRNFENVYRDSVDEWAIYDNSGDEPILVAEGTKGAQSKKQTGKTRS